MALADQQFRPWESWSVFVGTVKKKSAIFNMDDIPQGDIYFVGSDVCESETGHTCHSRKEIAPSVIVGSCRFRLLSLV